MGTIYICITVDWEGEKLSDLPELKQVRKKAGRSIPFTHFICPNYFTHTSARNATNADKIKPAIYQTDEIGLHIHCYRNLVEAADVEFRTAHNYYNPPTRLERKLQQLIPFFQKKVSGRGVPLSVYHAAEVLKITETSLFLLQKHLSISNVKGFRAGGWLANDVVLDTVSDLGFQYDSSAVPPAILSQGYSAQSVGNKQDDYGDTNGVFTEHIIGLWGNNLQTEGFLKNSKIRTAKKTEIITIGHQPFGYDANLLEIPNNVGLTDFSSYAQTVMPLIHSYIGQLNENPNQDFVVVYGCHQEGEAAYKAMLLEFIIEVQQLHSPYIQFTTLSAIAGLFDTNGFISEKCS